MKSLVVKNGLYVILNILDILGILACIVIYSTSFISFPLLGGVNIKFILPMLGFVLLVGIGFYILSNYVYIEERRALFLLLEITFIFVSVVLLEIFKYSYSLVMIASIVNVAFYIIILCEICICISKKISD